MHVPGVLESAEQAAADKFPENGRVPPGAGSIPLSSPPCP